ncbi:MAG: isopentenyl phosphate kinase [Candidatus Thermoplasmatota archaeon]|jgi:isopentenyl phosphate kinase|nr:isopentenyl phosphate kinase [Candidatus Thermoplasmatota archaeon]
MNIVKLGGSVITDKSRYKKLNRNVIDRLILEIANAKKEIILVHGGGSFGHTLAKEGNIGHGTVDNTDLTRSIVSRISYDMVELNLFIGNMMVKHGLNPFAIAPHSFIVQKEGSVKAINIAMIKKVLDKGLIPVIYGDVVIDTKWGYSIISGDDIIYRLSEKIKPEKVIFVSDVDGVLDKNKKVISMLSSINTKNIASMKKKIDVTGSIFKKIEVMKKISGNGINVMFINGKVRNRLYCALTGRDVVCTTSP